ncbi:hypothetical protein BGZ61DRAFT_559250 [Ilyonectria robusta]|uniref:uncharacterized protein n=1 Tax=Ilyonectria robusta TaxID=1079257 RepID=UPI001E8D8B30|nr:uncharacterized protein BGZ61DRAFT_559250 [Ilyonectria robusta]KAH8666256.1 hypothetical protein BGZ61DRAFT_559250 [Ilyonectria robusta]
MSGIELLGVAASGITLCEVLAKLAKFLRKVKGAREQFQKYLIELDHLNSIILVINKVTSGIHGLEHLTYQDKAGQTHGLIDFCKSNVEKAIGDLDQLLHSLDKPGEKWYHRLTHHAQKYGFSIHFALRQEDIQKFSSLIDGLSPQRRHAETQEMINSARDQISKSIQDINPPLTCPKLKTPIYGRFVSDCRRRGPQVIPRLSSYKKKEVREASGSSDNGSVQNIFPVSSTREQSTTATSYDQAINRILAPVQALARDSLSINSDADLREDESPSTTSSVSDFADGHLAIDDIEAVIENGQILFISTKTDNPEDPKVAVHEPKMLQNGECDSVDEEMIFAPDSKIEQHPAFLRTGIHQAKFKPSIHSPVGWFKVPILCDVTTGLTPTSETASGYGSDSGLESEALEANSTGSRRSNSSFLTGEDVLPPEANNHGELVPFQSVPNQPQPAGMGGSTSDHFNPTNRIIMCIQQISKEGSNTKMQLRVHCAPFTECQHARVEILNGEKNLNEAPDYEELLMICLRTINYAYEPIRSLNGVGLPLFDKCQDDCRHTLVTESRYSIVRCTAPAFFGAWSNRGFKANDDQSDEEEGEDTGSSYWTSYYDKTDSEDTESIESTDQDETRTDSDSSLDEAGNDSDSPVPDEAGSDSERIGPDADGTSHGVRGSEIQGQQPTAEAGENTFGPFLSVPCLFCRKEASKPQQETGMLTSFLIYGSVSYGYRCARCQGKNWITGSRWIWE